MDIQVRFLSELRRWLNLQLVVKITTFALAVGVLLALGYCLSFVLRGYAVPVGWYFTIILLSLVGGAVMWFNKRKNLEHAAKDADVRWSSKDIFTTAFHLRAENRSGEIYDLVQAQADTEAEKLMGKKPPLMFAKKTAIATTLVLVGTLWMLTLPPSASVQAQIEKEQMIESRTAEVQSQLEEYLRELEKELDDEEKEALKLNELKKWVKQLKQTKNEREALKQFARLEQKISQNLNRLEQRKDEQVLKKVAAELMKAPDVEARKLGKDLDKKDFKEASLKLKKMKFKQEKIDPKNLQNQKNKKLTELQKKIAKMRALSKRMAQANRPAGQGKQNAGKANHAGKQGKAGKGADAGQLGQAGDMQGMLEELDEDLEMLEKDLREMEMADEDFEDGDEDFEGELLGINEDIDDLEKRLRKMAAKRKARSKLKQLRKGLGQCQSYAMGQSQMLGLGGKKAGEGSDHTKRDQRDELKDNGQNSRLSGIKNKGPSKSSIEEAQSGTGVSSKSGTSKQRDYKRMFESFVHRDDIPEDMKAGVREYLENIHQVQPESDEEGE